jgi:hypothetical protein
MIIKAQTVTKASCPKPKNKEEGSKWPSLVSKGKTVKAKHKMTNTPKEDVSRGISSLLKKYKATTVRISIINA